MRFIFRHITAIIVLVGLGWWSIFYLPNSPTWSVLQLKLAIDNRDADAAARYIDFDAVVKNAGQEMMRENASGDPLSSLVGGGIMSMFSRQLAQVVAQQAKEKVRNGDRDVQMPLWAVAVSIVVMHRSGEMAWTRFTDAKGQTWELDLTRENGVWVLTEIKDIKQILQKVQRQAQKQYGVPGSPPPSSPAPATP